MEKPVITGAKFGLGFVVVFVLVGFAFDYVRLSLLDSLYPESSFGEPQIIRAEPIVRGGVFVVLATVENTGDVGITFDAEAAIFGSEGDFLDTCHTERSFELAPSVEVSFVATCTIGPVDDSGSSIQVANATLQFY